MANNLMGLKKGIDYENEIIEAFPGQTIKDFIIQLSREADEYNIPKIKGNFNGVILEITPDSFKKEEQDKLVEYYFNELEKRIKEYEQSPEGIKARKEREKQIRENQEIADKLTEKLETIDFNNLEDLLNWICDFQEVSDDIDVQINKNKIISKFAEYGFLPGINTGKDFNGNEPENVAKYIIGQALDGIIHVGAPHQIIHKFTNDWKQKFGKKVQEDKARIEEIKKSLN